MLYVKLEEGDKFIFCCNKKKYILYMWINNLINKLVLFFHCDNLTKNNYEVTKQKWQTQKILSVYISLFPPVYVYFPVSPNILCLFPCFPQYMSYFPVFFSSTVLIKFHLSMLNYDSGGLARYFKTVFLFFLFLFFVFLLIHQQTRIENLISFSKNIKNFSIFRRKKMYFFLCSVLYNFFLVFQHFLKRIRYFSVRILIRHTTILKKVFLNFTKGGPKWVCH